MLLFTYLTKFMACSEIVLHSKAIVVLSSAVFQNVILKSSKTVVSSQVLLQKVLTHHGASRIMKQNDSKGGIQGENFFKKSFFTGKSRPLKHNKPL